MIPWVSRDKPYKASPTETHDTDSLMEPPTSDHDSDYHSRQDLDGDELNIDDLWLTFRPTKFETVQKMASAFVRNGYHGREQMGASQSLRSTADCENR